MLNFRETADGILLQHYCNIKLAVVWSRAYHLDNQSSSNNNHNNNDDNNTKWDDVSSIVKCEAWKLQTTSHFNTKKHS